MTTLNPKLTNAGIALYPNPAIPGFHLQLTHIALGTDLYEPDGNQVALHNEVARFPILPNLSTKPTPTQVQISVNITNLDPNGNSPNGQWVGELGFYSGATLVAVWSQEEGALFYKTADFDVPVAYTMDFSILPAGSVTVAVSSDAAGMGAMILGHEAQTDPHPQYWNDARGNAKVQVAITALVGGAPGALDTLNELAAALGDDANFSATVTNALALRPMYYSISALPVTNVGPIIVAECGEVWNWSTSAYFTGYRSPLCGRPLDGHTLIPLVSEVDVVGGLLSKTAYAGLWGYAQENGLVVTQAVWTANIGAHNFVDVSGTQFRIPDLRNMFRRFTGTDADTANARTLGSFKTDTMQGHWHQHYTTNQAGAGTSTGIYGSGNTLVGGGDAVRQAISDGAHATPRVGMETAPKSTAYIPRIHV